MSEGERTLTGYTERLGKQIDYLLQKRSELEQALEKTKMVREQASRLREAETALAEAHRANSILQYQNAQLQWDLNQERELRKKVQACLASVEAGQPGDWESEPDPALLTPPEAPMSYADYDAPDEEDATATPRSGLGEPVGFEIVGLARVIEAFEAELGPELSVPAGAVVELLMPTQGPPPGYEDAVRLSGWLYARFEGSEGLIPEDFVEAVTHDDKADRGARARARTDHVPAPAPALPDGVATPAARPPTGSNMAAPPAPGTAQRPLRPPPLASHGSLQNLQGALGSSFRVTTEDSYPEARDQPRRRPSERPPTGATQSAEAFVQWSNTQELRLPVPVPSAVVSQAATFERSTDLPPGDDSDDALASWHDAFGD